MREIAEDSEKMRMKANTSGRLRIIASLGESKRMFLKSGIKKNAAHIQK
jgi:hypothetical protein